MAIKSKREKYRIRFQNGATIVPYVKKKGGMDIMTVYPYATRNSVGLELFNWMLEGTVQTWLNVNKVVSIQIIEPIFKEGIFTDAYYAVLFYYSSTENELNRKVSTSKMIFFEKYSRYFIEYDSPTYQIALSKKEKTWKSWKKRTHYEKMRLFLFAKISVVGMKPDRKPKYKNIDRSRLFEGLIKKV